MLKKQKKYCSNGRVSIPDAAKSLSDCPAGPSWSAHRLSFWTVTCTWVREPVVNPAAAGLMPVVRCEASTGCQPQQELEINESRGRLVTEEDKMSLCGMGSHSLANSLRSAAAVPVYFCVLMGVCVSAAFDWIVWSFVSSMSQIFGNGPFELTQKFKIYHQVNQ